MRVKERFKYAFKLLFDKDYKNGRIMTCGACGSKNITGFEDSLKEEKYILDDNEFNKYEEESICLDCGARCMETQFWTNSIPENMEAINEFKRKA